jgi:hypothetical protein
VSLSARDNQLHVASLGKCFFLKYIYNKQDHKKAETVKIENVNHRISVQFKIKKKIGKNHFPWLILYNNSLSFLQAF